MSEEPIVKPIASPKRDLKQLGQNSKAVVGELREFLASLKGKSPKEMMGAVAESSLVRSLLISSAVMSLVFVFSVIPYHLKQMEESAQAAQKESEPPGEKVEDKAAVSAGEKAEASGEQKQAPATPKTPEQKTADILGVGEVADPNANPLDSGGDDLLDGLDDL